jgi:outer membrane cobalamin receptor
VVWLVCVQLLSLSVLSPDPLPVTGLVVDTAGRAIPRAVVRVFTSEGADAGGVFTSVDGTFRVATPPPACRVEASLTGFETASAPCRTDAPLRLTLAVAPIAEQVVVSATRTEAPAGQVAAAVTTFDHAGIAERQEPPLADLLRESPGLTVVRTGAPGGVTTMFVRGGESNGTKVLLDGIPLNEPGGTFDLSTLTTENLERVEVVRGANSALFGSDAMTGVVQLFTRRGREARPDVGAAFEAGSFSTARASASIAGRAGRADYSAALAKLTTDNDVPNNGFDDLTVSGAGGLSFGARGSLRSTLRIERGRAGTPGQAAFGRPDLDAFFTHHDAAWGVSYDRSSGAVRQRAAYGVAVTRQESVDRVADPAYTPSFGDHFAPFEFADFPYDSRNDATRHRASYQVDGTITTARGGTHVETALVDWDGERATLADGMANTASRVARDNVGVSLQHQALWARVFVTAGVRFEHNASFGDAAVPRVAAAWYARSGNGAWGSVRLHATAGTGIKEPTILQSFSTNPYFLGNADLQPERTRTVDAGIEQRLAGDRVRVDLTWFDNRYRDIITLGDTDPLSFYARYVNIGLTRARGAELSGDLALTRGIRAGGGYTFTDSEILTSTSDNEVFAAGQPAFRRPRHAGFVHAAWNGGRASLNATGVFVGARSDSDLSSLFPPILRNEGYVTWGLRGAVRVTRAVSVTGAIDNLTDDRHMEPLGYPVLPRAIRLGARLHF